MSKSYPLFDKKTLVDLQKEASHKKVTALNKLQEASIRIFDRMQNTPAEQRNGIQQSTLLNEAGLHKQYFAQNQVIRTIAQEWIANVSLQLPRQNLAKSSEMARERDAALHQAMLYQKKFTDENKRAYKLEQELEIERATSRSLMAKLKEISGSNVMPIKGK